jgi:DNA polymerase phi
VDIFLRKEPTSQLTPTIILPLVQVIMGAGPDERQLSDKIIALLRNRFGKAKEVPTVVDISQTQKALEELHVMARKSHSSDVRDTIGACSLYLTRILLSDPINDSRTVIGVYRTSLADYATRKASPLHPNFIRDFVQRQPRSAWRMRDDFVQLVEKGVNVYRKCQTIHLLTPLFNQLVGIVGPPYTLESSPGS